MELTPHLLTGHVTLKVILLPIVLHRTHSRSGRVREQDTSTIITTKTFQTVSTTATTLVKRSLGNKLADVVSTSCLAVPRLTQLPLFFREGGQEIRCLYNSDSRNTQPVVLPNRITTIKSFSTTFTVTILVLSMSTNMVPHLVVVTRRL